MLVYTGIVMFAALLARQIYQYDRYHKAPWPLLLLAFATGFVAMIGVGHLEDFTHTLFDLVAGDRFAAQAMVAATHEELARLAIVGLIAVAFRKHFHDPMDGLIYGAFVGLGMALEESLFFVGMMEDAGLALIGTEAVRLLLHVLFGGLATLGVGLVATWGWQGFSILTAGLTAAIGLHWLWDMLVGLPMLNDLTVSVALRAHAVMLMTTLMALFGGAVMLATTWSRQVFAPQSRDEIWGWPFVRTAAPALSPVVVGDPSSVSLSLSRSVRLRNSPSRG
jgi:RsiW-degrading membrane proteinase PrsW (M82 family)